MSTKFKNLFVLDLSLASTLVFAEPGDKGGNGGGGHFCKDGKNEVYDLQEGRVRYKIPVIEVQGSQDDAIKFGLEKIKAQFPVFARLTELEVARVRKMMEQLNIKIERTLDSDNLYVDENCDYLQIANWDTTVGRLIVSSARWNLLSSAQQGVLIMHEAVYSLYRSKEVGLQTMSQNQSVDPVRKFIAEVYSSDKISTLLVKTPFLSGGVINVESKAPRDTRFIPRSPVYDRVLVENPYCSSNEYTLSFESFAKYDFTPNFGPKALQTIRNPDKHTVLNYDVTLPVSYGINEFTNIERLAAGSTLDNTYDPVTSASVYVTITRKNCGESGTFKAACGIEKSRGFTKMVKCVDASISRYQFLQP